MVVFYLRKKLCIGLERGHRRSECDCNDIGSKMDLLYI